MSTSKEETVLVIDDDPKIVELVARVLEDLGLEFQHATDGKQGLSEALQEDFALVVVDLGLPRLGGLEVCRRLREEKAHIPILILTGDEDPTKALLGFELGADEFIRKPLQMMEFRARVRALLRRAQLSSSADSSGQLSEQRPSIGFRDVTINRDMRTVSVDGVAIDLTPTEYDLLELFVENPHKVFSREEILHELWGLSNVSYAHNIRTHISRLRSKLDKAGTRGPYIVTHRGHGYRVAVEGDTADGQG